MADFRLSVSIISRGAGKSVMAAAAYRAGQCLTDERTGRIHDYTRKEGVEWNTVAVPPGSPEWSLKREELWNRAEAAESRVNARTAREFQLSLPHELDLKQRKALVIEFVAREFTAKGLVADIALHKPGREGDQRNYHAHILVPTRAIGPTGFGPKLRELNGVQQLEAWRKSWADIQNRHLETALGKEAPKVSHLSLVEQNIARNAQIHLGPHVSAMERRGIRTDRGTLNAAVRHKIEIQKIGNRVAEYRDILKYGTESRPVDRTVLDLTKLAVTMTRSVNEQIIELKEVLEAKKAIKPWSRKQIEAAVLHPEKQAMLKAKAEFEAKRRELGTAGQSLSHKKVMAWLHNPAKQVFQKIAHDIQLDLAAGRYAAAKRAHDKVARSVKTPWGKARIDELAAASRKPLTELRTKERRLRREAKRDRIWARRAARVADGLNLLREGGVAVSITMPKKTDLDKLFIRHAERGLVQTFNTLSPTVKQNLGKTIARSLGLGLGIGG
ncbi:MAG: MobQ family relaxase [Acidiphilium sp.]|nr:MobQ family relaxase [Acidiphilium sp.]